MPAEVPEKGEYRVPSGEKDQNGSWRIQAPEVVEQSLYQLKWYLFLAQLGHGMLRGEAVDRRVTGTVQRLLHNNNYITITSLSHISLEFLLYSNAPYLHAYHLLSYKTTVAEYIILSD